MLENLEKLREYRFYAIDGKIGEIHNFYFDDQTWDVRYLILNTGSWFNEHRILIPVSAISNIDWRNKSLSVIFTKAQIKNGPGIDFEKPVSRQIVQTLINHHQLLVFLPTNNESMPNWLIRVLKNIGTPHMNRMQKNGRANPNLRSAIEVIGYDLQAKDGQKGIVDDLIIDMKYWKICSVAIKINHWMSRDKKAFVFPENVEELSWRHHQMLLDVTKNEILNNPAAVV